MYDKELLQSKLQTLRKNKENIPVEELETKYIKPYKALLKDIRTQQREMFFDVLRGVYIDKTAVKDVEAHYIETCELVEKKLYEEYDADGAEELLRDFIGKEFINKKIVIRFEEDSN